jgi:hypothetical protein
MGEPRGLRSRVWEVLKPLGLDLLDTDSSVGGSILSASWAPASRT